MEYIVCRDCRNPNQGETFWCNGTRYCYDVRACAQRKNKKEG